MKVEENLTIPLKPTSKPRQEGGNIVIIVDDDDYCSGVDALKFSIVACLSLQRNEIYPIQWK